MLVAGGTIAGLIIAFLAFYGYRRNKHMENLRNANTKLQEAYDQLEETTKAKERIESELRIAREIQKRMLPHAFPRRRDVDLYAMMTPVREQFGDERLQALLWQDLGDARQTSEAIHKAVEDFVGGAEPSDDLTKLCIKMK